MTVTRTITPKGGKYTAGIEFTVLFDEADLPLWDSHNWRICPSKRKNHVRFYVRGGKSAGDKRFHQLIMGPPPAPGLTVDHINRNTMDCTRKNMRWANQSEQILNSGSRPLYAPTGYEELDV